MVLGDANDENNKKEQEGKRKENKFFRGVHKTTKTLFQRY